MVPHFRESADSEPASAEVLGKVADLSREDFQKAIKIADQGYRKYSTSTSYPERAAQLYRWYELIHANLEDCNPINQIVLMISGKNPQFGEWKDHRRGHWGSRIRRNVHQMVRWRGSTKLWRCHSFFASQHDCTYTQTTRWSLRNYYPLEFPCGDDYT